jgi:hypothetical protein
MKHETSMALHAYWQSCRGQAGVPAGAIRADELKPLLPSIFLLDGEASTGFQFQYCGAAITTRYGRDLSGEGFLALWAPEDRDLLSAELRGTGTRGPGMVMGMLGETAGGGFTCFEMLLLPLGSASGATGAIGSMARIGGHDETNRIRARLVGQALRSLRFCPRRAPQWTAGRWHRCAPLRPPRLPRYVAATDI